MLLTAKDYQSNFKLSANYLNYLDSNKIFLSSSDVINHINYALLEIVYKILTLLTAKDDQSNFELSANYFILPRQQIDFYSFFKYDKSYQL